MLGDLNDGWKSMLYGHEGMRMMMYVGGVFMGCAFWLTGKRERERESENTKISENYCSECVRRKIVRKARGWIVRQASSSSID